MLRKSVVALSSIMALALLAPEEVSARGGGSRAAAVRTGTLANNAWRSGFYPGFRPWRRPPVAAAAVAGAGLAYGAFPYADGYYDNAGYGNAYYPPYDDAGNYVYNAGGYYGAGGCVIVQRRIPARYGWVLRPIQVCN